MITRLIVEKLEVKDGDKLPTAVLKSLGEGVVDYMLAFGTVIYVAGIGLTLYNKVKKD